MKHTETYDPSPSPWEDGKGWRRRSGPEGYRIFDAEERSWLVDRRWYGGFLGWVDFWSHRAEEAMRFPGAKAARRMARQLNGNAEGRLAIINRRGGDRVILELLETGMAVCALIVGATLAMVLAALFAVARELFGMLAGPGPHAPADRRAPRSPVPGRR